MLIIEPVDIHAVVAACCVYTFGKMYTSMENLGEPVGKELHLLDELEEVVSVLIYWVFQQAVVECADQHEHLAPLNVEWVADLDLLDSSLA